MRLTKKELMSAINQPMCFGSRLVGKKMFAQIIKELCEYKDIEEELGIDLVTLFKALKEGIWYKDFKDGDNIKFSKEIEEHINWKELIVPAKYTHISLSFYKYGKTWALTKKELL